jgi:DNA repair protein RecO (recombination protein O)
VPVVKSHVLILKCQDWSETSQVVHLLSREVGRVRCLAKGSRRGLNPFGGPLDRWTLAEAVFSLRDPNRLATLMELYELDRFEGLREKLPAYLGACCMTEAVLALVPDADAQPALFDLVVQAFSVLAAAEPRASRAVTFAAAWRLLAALGYGPDLARCVECGTPLQAGSAREFSPGLGGPVCTACRPKGGDVLHLGTRAAEAVAFLKTADWRSVQRVRLSDPTARQVRAALSSRFAELAGRQLSAARYV